MSQSPKLNESRDRLPETIERNSDELATSIPELDTVAREPRVINESSLDSHPAQIDRFHVEAVLGRGGFGRVFRAHDPDLRRKVAIKVPHTKHVSNPADIQLYLAEAQVVASLVHRAIVPVYDVGQTDQGLCYVVSKFIEGSDLAARTHGNPLTRNEAVELVAVVAEALHYAHTQGVFHRDIKPANILLDSSGNPFVADFGLALKEEEVGTGSGWAGTPAYMSPEQARGEGHLIDGRSDIFSLGVVLYELLCGRRPFLDDTLLIESVQARPLRQRDDTIDPELDRICLKALARNIAERYPTAKDMADDLIAYLHQADAEPVPEVQPTSALADRFLRLLANHGVELSDDVAAAASDWSDDAIAVLLDEFEDTRAFTPYQVEEIKAGRVDSLAYGQYAVRELVGEGSQASVFKACHLGLKRLDAIKVIVPELLERLDPATKERVVKRFSQGAQAAAQLDHENIVRTYNFDRREYVVALEFVDGPDLATLADQSPLSERDAVDFVLQAARGLEHAHTREQPVFHRDIRPRNLLFDERTSKIKITDWGVARISEEATVDVPATRLTQPGEKLGNSSYISPEQAENTGEADHRSDIYSLGCTLFTLLTQRPIYDGKTSTLTMMAHCDPDVPIPSLQIATGASEELDEVFRRMVAKHPDDRYQSASEVITALEHCQSIIGSRA